MSIRLLVRQRSEAGGADKPQELLLAEPLITIGRDKTCQVQLSQMAVSRQHARITRDGGLCFVEDLGSAYGTQVNGKPLPKGEKRLLREGDLIAVAQYDVTFDKIAETNPAAEKTNLFAKAAVKKALQGLSTKNTPFFRVMNGPMEGHKFPLEEAQELVIGREEGVDIVLQDDLVSRRHVKLRRDLAGVHAEDLGSRNGMTVNGKRAQRKTLKDQDDLEVGGTRLLFIDPHAVRDPGASRPSIEASLPRRESSERTAYSAAALPEEDASPEASEHKEASVPLPKPSGAEEVLDSDGLSARRDFGTEEPENQEPEEGEEGEEGEPEEDRPLWAILLERIKEPRVMIPVIIMASLLLFGLVLIIAVLAGA